jgi:hypothetical protein
MRPSATRRRLLAAATAALAGLAGCNGDDDVTATPTSTATDATEAPGTDDPTIVAASTQTATPTESGAATRTATTTPGDGDLDLREANVTGVAVSDDGGGVRFDVTLYHDDDGEDGYANWWQVERLDGTRLGRRDLLHAHGTREFTRSATVSIPDGVTCVVVRGHDETHDYGGQAMLVDLDSGATRAVRQGPEPRTFAPDDCP